MILTCNAVRSLMLYIDKWIADKNVQTLPFRWTVKIYSISMLTQVMCHVCSSPKKEHLNLTLSFAKQKKISEKVDLSPYIQINGIKLPLKYYLLLFL